MKVLQLQQLSFEWSHTRESSTDVNVVIVTRIKKDLGLTQDFTLLLLPLKVFLLGLVQGICLLIWHRLLAVVYQALSREVFLSSMVFDELKHSYFSLAVWFLALNAFRLKKNTRTHKRRLVKLWQSKTVLNSVVHFFTVREISSKMMFSRNRLKYFFSCFQLSC